MELIIREMSMKDVEQVAELEQATFSKPWSKEDFITSLQRTENIYIIAEKNETIVGYCGMWGIAGEGQINNIAVRPGYRKRNIAYKILQYTMEKAQKKDIKAFTLEVRQSNQPAQRLYHKLGFKTAGIRKNFYEAPIENAIIMWKNDVSTDFH